MKATGIYFSSRIFTTEAKRRQDVCHSAGLGEGRRQPLAPPCWWALQPSRIWIPSREDQSTQFGYLFTGCSCMSIRKRSRTRYSKSWWNRQWTRKLSQPLINLLKPLSNSLSHLATRSPTPRVREWLWNFLTVIYCWFFQFIKQYFHYRGYKIN